MKTALCLIRNDPPYRRQSFENGLRRAGFHLIEKGMGKGPDDLLIIWNRYGSNGAMADSWEKAGGTVLVAENGYVGKDENGFQLYALSIHGHNGSGRWHIGAEDRFAGLGIELKPWTRREGYSLICGQRSIGSRLMASPPDWHKHAQREITPQGNPTKIRLHPGNHEASVPLETDLASARDCVIWASSSGVKALVMGIPVRYAAPHWICSRAASNLQDGLLYDDLLREQAMHEMSWAQWRIRELETGEPFVVLHALAKEGK